MGKWYSIDKKVPSDSQHVFIRLAYNDYAPIECIYSTSTEIFSAIDTDATYPLNDVLIWYDET